MVTSHINHISIFPDDTVFCGIDVGKHHHHIVALTPTGEKIFSQKFTQDEQEIRELLTTACQYGTPVVIVDQPRSIGSLLISICQDMSVPITYISSLAMRRFADMYPGNAKTDARDALMIAKAGKNMPEILREIPSDEEVFARMRILAGFDDDLAKAHTAQVNRLRGLLSTIHPGLEKALSPYFDHKVTFALLSLFGGPEGIKTASSDELETIVLEHAPRVGGKILTTIHAALTGQTVIIPGTAAAEQVIAFTATQIQAIRAKRNELEQEFEQLLIDNPLGEIICSMPGVGIRLGVKILVEIHDIHAFPSARHLAAYAGLAPRTHRSGTSIKGEYTQHAGNKRLKNALFRAAFASLTDPLSKTYYEKKRAEGKTHNTAIICLARQRCTTLYQMLTTHTPYQQKQPSIPQAA